MTFASLKPLFAGAVLMAAQAALASTSTSVPAFEAKIATARTASSPDGATVNLAEMRDALNEFWFDDWWVDIDEAEYLGEQLESSTFLTGISALAQENLVDFHELNDGGDIAQLNLARVTTPASQLFGASGPLASNARIAEGPISGPGVANNDTLMYAYWYVLTDPGAYEDQWWFQPINAQELRQVLSGSANMRTPTQAEVDGAVAYLTAIGGGQRLYVGYWHSYLWGGEMAGYVVASVSEDRRFARMVRVLSWGD